MPLSWNEIKDRALRFSREFADESSERAEAKTFWDQFFDVFGMSRRRLASFEKAVDKLGGEKGLIDLLWPGQLLVEHKSKGKDLDRAHGQALDYFPGLAEHELPRYVLVSDFARFRLYDLEKRTHAEFELHELHKHVRLFGFMAGYEARTYREQDPVNVDAAERMGKLHDALKAAGYEGHKLEVLLVRLLFCLFADDAGVWGKRQFQDLIEFRTAVDGSDLGPRLAQLFQVLNTPPPARMKTLDEQLAEFPYVNGRLFEEALPLPDFDTKMRSQLIAACALDWAQISPAIFGAMFQSVMDAKARRNLGAHYTSEKNILKLIGPLFLDELRAEFERIRHSPPKLKDFHVRLSNLRFLDPACGCGNFLVITYRELRLLELDVMRAQYAQQQSLFGKVSEHVAVDVDQFYGIEIEEFPAQIAQVALWLTDHQMNVRVSEEFGEHYARLPLVKSPNIVFGHDAGNALRIDWETLVPKERLHYILGNPPFVGAKLLNDSQRSDLAAVLGEVRNAGLLDYVSGWFVKAARIASKAPVRVAFVATSSITQGEQPAAMWPLLWTEGMKIRFAHRTFRWTSEARGMAAVHCVIVGFEKGVDGPRTLFEYEDVAGEPHVVPARTINPYLVDADDIVLQNRTKPLCPSPAIGIGNKPIDGGYLLFSPDERAAFLSEEPGAADLFKRWLGADEFLNGIERWCLFLKDVAPERLRSLPRVVSQLDLVRRFRLGEINAKSGREAKAGQSSRALAATPTRFHVEFVPEGHYLLIPRHSSERRRVIPIGFVDHHTLSGDANLVTTSATPFHFGVLQSTMHMAWVRYTCGRLKSDIRYSAGIVYNNFPWPDSPSDEQSRAIEAAAQLVLDARAAFPDATLADLYDPLTMPPALMKAHETLDRAVDAAYGKKGFKSDAERVAFLFGLYAKYTSLLPASPTKAARRSRKVVLPS